MVGKRITLALLLITLGNGPAGGARDPSLSQLDWRTVPNVVSGVKQQGDCDSSYAFATAGLLEGQQVRNNKTANKLIELSAQNIIDCSRHNYHCHGGSPETSLRDLYELGGLESAKTYPQTALTGDCKFNKTRSIMRPISYLELPSADEEIMRQMVTNYGPVAVRMQATEKLIFKYKSGVFSDTNCTGTVVNHSALIVGYGDDPKEGKYWLVKNSWGTRWGERGYFKIKRGINMCAIALYPTLAILGGT